MIKDIHMLFLSKAQHILIVTQNVNAIKAV